MFITEMLRFGNPEAHHYIVGIYTTKIQATFAGECEKSWRGGKYDYIVSEFEVDIPVPEDIYNYHMRV